MTEELIVDPALLQAAGTELQELTYPASLPPLTLAAGDPVSVAINETLAVIESPVISGLPAIKAAHARTGSRLAIAAGIYADTDRRLGDHLSQLGPMSAPLGQISTMAGAVGAVTAPANRSEPAAQTQPEDQRAASGKTPF